MEDVKKMETGAAVATRTLWIAESPCSPWAHPSPTVGRDPILPALPTATTLALSIETGRKYAYMGRRGSEGLQHVSGQDTKDPA